MRFILAAVFALSFSSVFAPEFSQAQAIPVIKIDGSSTVFPITEAMAEEFQKMKKGKVRTTVGISGTGGGFKKFCRGEIDVQNASRPIQNVGKQGEKSEMDMCRENKIKFYEIPVAYDAMVIVVHPKNDWIANISVAELKTIWAPEAQGKITKWNQVNPKWPDQPIKLYGAGSDSGTFDYFTEAVVGKAKSSRGDYTASEDDNTLVQGVSGDRYALGYLPLSYYEANKSKLKALGIMGGDKAPKKDMAVMPTRETVENGTYFPLSRPLFIYVSEASVKRPEVKEFTEFYLKSAVTLVPQAKYVPLPAKIYSAAQTHFANGKLGTVFAGHAEIGMKIEDLLKKESAL